jgi:hypothetical protein
MELHPEGLDAVGEVWRRAARVRRRR